MANDTAQPGKPTVIYNPLRLNWKNVVAGTVIALLMVAIGVFSFTYYNPDATPVPPVVIKSGTQSAKTSKATPSAEKKETADWKTYSNQSYGFLIKYPKGWNYNDKTKYETQSCDPGPNIGEGLLFLGRKSLKCTGVGHMSLWDDNVEFVVFSTTKYNPLKPITEEIYTDITVDEEKAVKNFLTETSEGPRCTCTRIYVNHNNNGFMIEFVNKDLKGNYDPIYDTILSTFRFE